VVWCGVVWCVLGTFRCLKRKGHRMAIRPLVRANNTPRDTSFHNPKSRGYHYCVDTRLSYLTLQGMRCLMRCSFFMIFCRRFSCWCCCSGIHEQTTHGCSHMHAGAHGSPEGEGKYDQRDQGCCNQGRCCCTLYNRLSTCACYSPNGLGLQLRAQYSTATKCHIP